MLSVHTTKGATQTARGSATTLCYIQPARFRRHALLCAQLYSHAKYHTQGTTPPAVGHSTTLECVTRCLTLSTIYSPRSYRYLTALSPTSATAYLGLCICIECVFATAKAPYIYIMYADPRNIGTHEAPTNDIFRKSIDGVRPQQAAQRLPHIEKTVARGASSAPATAIYYQLAFFTPGIRPFDAISRN